MGDARSARRDPQYRMVERTAILERLDASPDATLITVEASAGYGKSILLQQWAKRVGPSAYLRLTESHRDPTVLVLDLARALGPITRIDAEVVKHFSSRTLEPGLQAASRLAAAVSAFTGSALLVLDDVHVLQERRAADALTVFIEHLPPGIQTAAAGHDASVLHPARMRAAGYLAEVTEFGLVLQ